MSLEEITKVRKRIATLRENLKVQEADLDRLGKDQERDEATLLTNLKLKSMSEIDGAMTRLESELDAARDSLAEQVYELECLLGDEDEEEEEDDIAE